MAILEIFTWRETGGARQTDYSHFGMERGRMLRGIAESAIEVADPIVAAQNRGVQ
jgi:hypothetical protein